MAGFHEWTDEEWLEMQEAYGCSDRKGVVSQILEKHHEWNTRTLAHPLLTDEETIHILSIVDERVLALAASVGMYPNRMYPNRKKGNQQ